MYDSGWKMKFDDDQLMYRWHVVYHSARDSRIDNESLHACYGKIRPSRCKLQPIVRHISVHFQKVLYYRVHRLPSKSFHYDTGAARSVAIKANLLQLQTKLLVLDFLDYISILSFLSKFKLACNKSGVLKEPDLCSLHHIWSDPLLILSPHVLHSNPSRVSVRWGYTGV